eukprot:5228546-Prymnesium_polylepis.6
MGKDPGADHMGADHMGGSVAARDESHATGAQGVTAFWGADKARQTHNMCRWTGGVLGKEWCISAQWCSTWNKGHP